MQSQSFEAVFENGVLRPLEPLQLSEGESVKLIIESPTPSRTKTKGFPPTGIVAKLTANPLKIADFQPMTREEANERW